jgi:uncharacterized protein with GYD domain
MIIMGFNQLRAKQCIYIHMRFLCSEKRMSKYTLLINWTEQGIRNVKDTIKREKSFEDAVQKAGGKSLGFYYTIGRYDMVAMVEAPTDETMASILFSLGSLGNVRTETLKTFSVDETANIIEKLS